MASKLKTKEEILEVIKRKGAFVTLSPTEAERASELASYGVACIYNCQLPGRRMRRYRFEIQKFCR